MSLLFVKSGLQTSIQDAGRFGQMHYGVSQGGAMDPVSMQMANWLVEKPVNSPVIEIAGTGPAILFEADMSIALSGAEFDLTIGDKNILTHETISVSAGDSLKFNRLKNGTRAYLAFSGKLNLPSVLSSYSTHLTAGFGGFNGRNIQNGDRVIVTDVTNPAKQKIPSAFKISYTGKNIFRCVKSVESDLFDSSQVDSFFSQSYRVSSSSNRMGIRLKGERPLNQGNMEITSSGLTQGSIQIPPSGQPIISSVDGQTIGGYPRIAGVISADLHLLGQLNANDRVRFILIEKSKALKILKEKQSRLKSLYNNQTQN